MKKKNKRILGLVSWLPVCIVAVYIYHSTSDRNEHLSPGKTGNTTGIIKEFRDIYRSPPEFIYSYQVSGQTYEGSYFLEKEFVYLTVDSLKKFIGKKFTVQYSLEKPKYSNLLIHKSIK